jgi:hypothetical protein
LPIIQKHSCFHHYFSVFGNAHCGIYAENAKALAFPSMIAQIRAIQRSSAAKKSINGNATS